MNKLADLQEQYEGLVRQQDEIYNRAIEVVDGVERGFQNDEEARFDDLTKQRKALEKEIERAQKLEEFESAKILSKRVAQPKKTEEQKVNERFSLVDTLRTLADGGRLEGVAAEINQEAQIEARGSNLSLTGNFAIPGSMINMRAQTAGTAATAGTLIPTDLAPVEAALFPTLLTARAGARVLSGLTGNLTIPIGNALATATWEGETDEAANTDPSIKKIDLTPQRLAAITTVSKQLIQQSSVGVENWIRGMLSEAIARAVDEACIEGNGSGITGIISTTNVSDVTFGGGPTRAKLLEMVAAVQNYYALTDRMTWMINPDIAALLKALSLDSGSGRFVMENNTIEGYPVITSTLIPNDIATDKNLILFGNFDHLVIANWGGVDIMVDPYTKSEFGNIRIVANSYWDADVIHARSFAKGDDVVG